MWRTVSADNRIHPLNASAERTFELPSEKVYGEKLEQVGVIAQINQEIRAKIPDPRNKTVTPPLPNVQMVTQLSRSGDLHPRPLVIERLS